MGELGRQRMAGAFWKSCLAAVCSMDGRESRPGDWEGVEG